MTSMENNIVEGFAKFFVSLKKQNNRSQESLNSDRHFTMRPVTGRKEVLAIKSKATRLQ